MDGVNNHNQIKRLIQEFSGNDRTITIPSLYIKLVGDYAAAALLNQIVFWSDKTNRTDGFFYKKYADWQEELLLSERQVRYATNKLKNLGLVETMLKKADGSPTLHYRVDMDKLADSILTKCQNGNLQSVRLDNDKVSDSLTEITSYNSVVVDEPGILEAKETKNQKEKKINAFQFYQENFGVLGSYIADQLGTWIDDFNDNEAVVVEALKIALENQKSFRYADAILKKWFDKGLQTLEQVKADQVEFQNQLERKSGYSGKNKKAKTNWDEVIKNSGEGENDE